MGDRVTMKDLHNVVALLAVQAVRYGITEPLRLDEGSKVHGRAFRLYFADGMSFIGTSNGFLGWTKKEAHSTMWTILHTMQDADYYTSLEDV